MLRSRSNAKSCLHRCSIEGINGFKWTRPSGWLGRAPIPRKPKRLIVCRCAIAAHRAQTHAILAVTSDLADLAVGTIWLALACDELIGLDAQVVRIADLATRADRSISTDDRVAGHAARQRYEHHPSHRGMISWSTRDLEAEAETAAENALCITRVGRPRRACRARGTCARSWPTAARRRARCRSRRRRTRRARRRP